MQPRLFLMFPLNGPPHCRVCAWLSCDGVERIFIYASGHKRMHNKQLTRVHAGASAGGDDDWKNIINSEANLASYLSEEGFRYCLNKTPEELEKEGDYNIFEKMFGATSNNAARMAARSFGRSLTIDAYDAKKAAENKEWVAKYGYKRWVTSYVDKSDLETEKGAAPAAVAASAKKAAPPAQPRKSAFSFPKFGGQVAASTPGPAKKSSPVKVTAAAKPAAAKPAPTPKAAAPKAKAAAPTGPLSGKPQAQGKGNLNLLKKK